MVLNLKLKGMVLACHPLHLFFPLPYHLLSPDVEVLPLARGSLFCVLICS